MLIFFGYFLLLHVGAVYGTYDAIRYKVCIFLIPIFFFFF